MKKVSLFLLALVCLLFLFFFTNSVYSAELSITKEESTFKGVKIKVTSDVEIDKIKIYKKSGNGKYVMFYQSKKSGLKSVDVTISRYLLSTTDNTEIKVIAYDKDGKLVTGDETIDPIPSVAPINPSETAKPSWSPSPIPTKPTPTTTSSASPTTTPSESAEPTTTSSPSASEEPSPSPSTDPSESPSPSPSPSPSGSGEDESLEELLRSDQPLTGEQVGRIMAHNARIMLEHKKSFGYNVNYGSATTKKKWEYWVNSRHVRKSSKKEYKYWVNCEGFCQTVIKWSLGVGRREICGLLSGTGSTINAPKVTMTINGKKYTGGKLNDESINNLRPGDILIWRGRSHLAMYVGNKRIIEISDNGVREEPVTWYNGSRVLKYVWRPTDELAAQLDKSKISIDLSHIDW